MAYIQFVRAGASGAPRLTSCARREGAASGRSCRRRQQSAQPHDVVGGRGEGEDPGDQRAAPMAQLPQPADGFHPAETLLDEFALPLTHLIARVPRRPRIDGTPSTDGLLRDMRGDGHLAQIGDEVARCHTPCRPRR